MSKLMIKPKPQKGSSSSAGAASPAQQASTPHPIRCSAGAVEIAMRLRKSNQTASRRAKKPRVLVKLSAKRQAALRATYTDSTGSAALE